MRVKRRRSGTLAEVWPEVEAGKHRRVGDDSRTGAVRRHGHRARRTIQYVDLNLVVKPEIKRYRMFTQGACRNEGYFSQPQTGEGFGDGELCRGMTEIKTSFIQFLLITNLKYRLLSSLSRQRLYVDPQQGSHHWSHIASGIIEAHHHVSSS